MHGAPTAPGFPPSPRGTENETVMGRKRIISSYPSSSAMVMFLSVPTARLKEEWGWPCPAACLQEETSTENGKRSTE